MAETADDVRRGANGEKVARYFESALCAEDEIADSVKRFLTREVPLLQSSPEIEKHASLVTSGVLDSIDLIKLVSFLERAFDLVIESADVQAGHLETIASIEAFVRSRAAR